MGKPIRILIVDDHESVLFVLETTLRRTSEDYEVVAVQSGQQALDAVQRGMFSLMITDIKLRDMSGIELSALFRERYPKTCIIWITAYGCRPLAKQARQLKIFRCLEKPLEVEVIRQVTREALLLENPMR